MPIEHKIYNDINSIFGVGKTVLKGLNVLGVASELRAKWDRFDDPVAIMIDAAKFDRSVSNDALVYEHEIYQAHYPKSLRLRKLLAWQRDNVCVYSGPDGYLRYKSRHLRMSGDDNTGGGNTLIMCCMIHSLLERLAILDRVAVADNGDDAVLIMEKQTFNARFRRAFFHNHFEQFGFDVQIEGVVDQFERIKFCQMHPVFDGEVWVMMRDPVTALCKDLSCARYYSSKLELASWLLNVGMCGLAAAGRLPIFQAFYQHLIRLARYNLQGRNAIVMNLKEGGLTFWSKGMNRTTGKVSDAARVSAYFATGITPTMQVSIEAAWDEMPSYDISTVGFREVFEHIQLSQYNLYEDNLDRALFTVPIA
jgi:hypothetical protein